MINIYFDGGTALNSVCFVDESINKICIESIQDKSTNNELEYNALITAVIYALKNYNVDDVVFCGDSELIINQMLGKFKLAAKNLKPLYNDVKSMLGEHGNFKWVPRDLNLAGIELEFNTAGKRKEITYNKMWNKKRYEHAD